MKSSLKILVLVGVMIVSGSAMAANRKNGFGSSYKYTSYTPWGVYNTSYSTSFKPYCGSHGCSSGGGYGSGYGYLGMLYMMNYYNNYYSNYYQRYGYQYGCYRTYSSKRCGYKRMNNHRRRYNSTSWNFSFGGCCGGLSFNYSSVSY